MPGLSLTEVLGLDGLRRDVGSKPTARLALWLWFEAVRSSASYGSSSKQQSRWVTRHGHNRRSRREAWRCTLDIRLNQTHGDGINIRH